MTKPFRFPEDDEQAIALIMCEITDSQDVEVVVSAFIAYWLDDEHKCLDQFPNIKRRVLAHSNDRVNLEISVREHKAHCGVKDPRKCAAGVAMDRALAALNKVRPVPTMVDDTGNYDWPRYYSDPDAEGLN